MAVEVPDEFISVEGANQGTGVQALGGIGYNSRIAPRSGIRASTYEANIKALNWLAAEGNLIRYSMVYKTPNDSYGKQLKSSVTSFPATPNVAEFKSTLSLNRDILDIYFEFDNGSMKVEVYDTTGVTLRGSVTAPNTSGTYQQTLQITGLVAGETTVTRIFAHDYDGVTDIDISKLRIMESYLTASDIT